MNGNRSRRFSGHNPPEAARRRSSHRRSRARTEGGESPIHRYQSSLDDNVFESETTVAASPATAVIRFPSDMALSPPVMFRFSTSPRSRLYSPRPQSLARRPIRSLPRYSELSAAAAAAAAATATTTAQILSPINIQGTPPPPYRDDVDTRRRTESTSRRFFTLKIELRILLLAASIQTILGSMIVCMEVATLSFLPSTGFEDMTFYWSGVMLFLIGIQGIIAFFYLRKRSKSFKFSAIVSATLSTVCFVLLVYTANKSREKRVEIVDTFACFVSETSGGACICYPPDHPDIGMASTSSDCSRLSSPLIILMHSITIANYCGCIPTAVVIISIVVAFVCFRQKNGGGEESSRRVDPLPTYDDSCQRRRDVSDHLEAIEEIDSPPPAYASP